MLSYPDPRNPNRVLFRAETQYEHVTLHQLYEAARDVLDYNEINGFAAITVDAWDVIEALGKSALQQKGTP